MRIRSNCQDTGKLVLSGILAAVAVVLNIAESFLPPLMPLPGIKLGIANSVVVFAAYFLNFRCAAAVQTVRILAGALLSGQVISAIYSIAGGMASLAVIRFLRLATSQMWAVSAFAAVANVTGQVTVAFFVMQSDGVFAYLPYMIIASVISGTVTGVCALTAYTKIRRMTNGKR